MAWTTSDLTTVETAIREAMTAGVVQVSIGGDSAQAYTLEALRALRAEIKAELAAANENSRGGLRTRKMVPGSTG